MLLLPLVPCSFQASGDHLKHLPIYECFFAAVAAAAAAAVVPGLEDVAAAAPAA